MHSHRLPPPQFAATGDGAVNKNGIAHGIGERRHANGNVYVGNFVNGKKCGKGKMTFPDGCEYEGDWENDQKHGKGKYTWPDGETYVGNYPNGKKHGKGKMKYANWDEYFGEWEDGRKHGKGKYTSSRGNIIIGEWEKGVMNGEFTLKRKNGKVFKQVYVQGDLKSNKQCVSDITSIHRLLSSPRSCAEDIYDVIVFNQYDKECPICSEKFHPDVDAKKPVIGSCLCNYTICHKCVLDTAQSKMNGGGVVPARVDCMGCRAKDAFCPAVPQYNWTLINFLKRSIPVLRKTDHCG